MSAQQQADQAVKEAEETLARLEAVALAADARLAEETTAALEASKRKAEADPFAEKAFLAAMRDAELGAAKVAACERLASQARAQAEAAREALRAAELQSARVRLDELRPSLEADGRRLEAMVREFRAKACEAVRAHRVKLDELNAAAENAFVPDLDGGPHWFEPLRSPWALSMVTIKSGELLGEKGVLGMLEELVDKADLIAWRASQPPPPLDLNEQAEMRRREQLGRGALEREAEEERAKERRAMRSESISDEDLEHYRQKAIDAKVARDNPTSQYPEDFTPKVG